MKKLNYYFSNCSIQLAETPARTAMAEDEICPPERQGLKF
jgi:hypothetical protein